MAVRFIPLGSGSRGNASLVERVGSARLLIDAGLSARDLARRLEAVGVSPASIDAIVLTHEHGDHARGAERFSARHGTRVISSFETLEAMDRSPQHFAAWQPLVEARSIDLGDLQIEPFPVPHDAARPVGLVVRGEGVRVGIVTDIGHATGLVRERLRGCHLLMVEANHDERMLQAGPYPWSLKQRVASRMGHLSNRAAAALLRDVVDGDCRAVVLAHLSERNNTPALARRAAGVALNEAGRCRVEMRIATPRRPSPPIHL